MTTYVRAPEAARRLGVTTPTLYAYVSRGRIGRRTAPDGRTSLFDLDEIEALAARGRRRADEPPPTIDVRIGTAVTQLDEEGVRYRGRPVTELLGRPFEEVAAHVWDEPAVRRWAPDPTVTAGRFRSPTVADLIALANSLRADADAPTEFARRLIASIPAAAGVPDTDGPIAARIAAIWHADPSPELTTAMGAALASLADHELATSTLAVRVATSVRAPVPAVLIAGLATVEGDLHGGATLAARLLLDEVAERGAAVVVDEHVAAHRRLPGFGHSIYRRCDPRVEPLLDRVRRLPDPHGRLDDLDELVRVAGAAVPQQPNIDLAIGAFGAVAGLPPDAPLFAIARIVGWTAHHVEELAERPLRYRGLARATAE